jgi:hypothetical protein
MKERGGLDGGFKGSEERKWERESVEFMSLGRGWWGCDGLLYLYGGCGCSNRNFEVVERV